MSSNKTGNNATYRRCSLQ